MKICLHGIYKKKLKKDCHTCRLQYLHLKTIFLDIFVNASMQRFDFVAFALIGFAGSVAADFKANQQGISNNVVIIRGTRLYILPTMFKAVYCVK